MNSVPYVDELIREYLVFRGFTTTLKAFDTDNRLDKDKGFQPEKISQHLIDLVAGLDIQGVIGYWRYLDLRFFSRLEEKYSSGVRFIEQELVRYCIITALKEKARTKVLECLEIYAPEMIHTSEWTRWFALPYVLMPQDDPYFRLYFTPQWQETFRTSLRNFIDTVFKHMPLPGLLGYQIDFLNRKSMQTEIQNLKATVRQLRGQLETSTMQTRAIQRKLDYTSAAAAAAATAAAVATAMSSSTNSSDHPECSTPPQPPPPAPATSTSTSMVGLPIKSIDRASISEGIRGFWGRSTGQNHPPESVRDSLSKSHSFSSRVSDLEVSRQATQSTDAADRRSIRSVSSLPIMENVPYTITSQEIYQEHSSEVVDARFSIDGNLIASFDTDGIIKVWSPSSALTKANVKITTVPQVTCVEWEPKASKVLLFIGTSSGLIKIYSTETKAVVHEFVCPNRHPRLTHLCCARSAALLVSISLSHHPTSPSTDMAASGSGGADQVPTSPLQLFPSIDSPPHSPGSTNGEAPSISSYQQTPSSPSVPLSATSMSVTSSCPISPSLSRRTLVSTWNWKTRAHQNSLEFDTMSPICSVRFNHNGQLMVIAEGCGKIRILDVITLSIITEWTIENQEICMAVFSFDENDIVCVNIRNQITRWSLHKPGTCTSTSVSGTATEISESNEFEPLDPHLVAMSDDAEHSVACINPFQAAIFVVYQNRQTTSDP
ncbi:hypothetical protein H4R33_005625 [Dimargaris cristalligena]|uniref:WD40-repeat-containing domain protein n=1 Tax=Dimargaris cristalligena TaxID=215637 RepID=A0A4P9ZSQ8_9FUNG|nr:hypothetical protein H4R33_005625 [Dimargaris cristalligena]RKP36228.1 WD40-repeat-containing domain protein [Dimargaris cristalligena]|eukprot:RKP36228.1 WD40-repeat-containing domain protein [Dimargaris cristalligena]